MGNIVRYSKADADAFFEEAAKTKQSGPPNPRPQHLISKRTASLMQRWQARGVVRKLFPELTPNDPRYHTAVDDEVLRS